MGVGNATRLMEKIYQKHNQMPHIVGAAIGSCVAISAIHKLGNRYSYPSLTLVDPLTSVVGCLKATRFFGMQYLAAWAVRRAGTDCFFTTEKAKDPVFKQIPIVCFTSTKRNDLFEPGYWKCMNPVFKALLGTNEKFPVTKENLAVIERKNDLGVPRVLVSARGFIMRSAQMVLRQGTHTPKSLKYCQEDLESRNPGHIMKDNCLDPQLSQNRSISSRNTSSREISAPGYLYGR